MHTFIHCFDSINVLYNERYDVSKKGNVYTHFWLFNLASGEHLFENLAPLLSGEEKFKASKFIFDKEKIRYAASHALMRLVLSKYLSLKPLEINYRFGANGKPYLQEPNEKLQFNLSHSHDIILLAVSSNAAVGADVEFINQDFEFKDVAGKIFHPYEIKQLGDHVGYMTAVLFYKYWTRKEAALKLFGSWLGENLKGLDVSQSNSHSNLVEVFETDILHDLYLYSLPLFGSYAAALASTHRLNAIECFNVKKIEELL